MDKKTWNYDDELIQLISEKYHVSGKSGAQAMIDAWTEIRDGKLVDICIELNIPEPLGLIHGLNTFSKKLMEASEIRLQQKDRERKLTPSQKAAWDNLVKEFGESARQLEWPSIRECSEEAVKAMQVEADKLLNNPVVRKAYDRFMLVAELCKENKNG